MAMNAELHGPDADFSRHLISELLAGECDDDSFVRAVADAYRSDPDAPWEVLALIDRYHRLGQLPTDHFRLIKARIEQLALGRHARAADAAPQVGAATPSAPSAPSEHTQELRVKVRTATATAGSQTPATSAASAAPATRAAFAAPSATPAAPPAPTAVLQGAAPVLGEVLAGRYELQSAIGRGGMGTVYKALDRTRAVLGLGQAHVAVKVLHAEQARRPELLATFAREFEFAQGLSHPNIVNVHEIEQRGQRVFFAMELLEGAHLSQIIARTAGHPLPRPQVLAIVRDIGAALAHAHERGVVHGDLKPHNIMVTDDGEVRVLDFGAACTVTDEPWISDFATDADVRAATPAYASCQVLEGARPEPVDDMYALACVTYVLLAGGHPFGGRTAKEARMLKLRPRRPRGLSATAWTALNDALSWSRERRPRDVNEWLARMDLRDAAPRLLPQSLLVSAVRSAVQAGSPRLLASSPSRALPPR
jgi:hypothetical protein